MLKTWQPHRCTAGCGAVSFPGNRWDYPTITVIEDLLLGFESHQCRYYGCCATFGRTEWQRRWLSHLDAVLDPLLPANAKYIVYGWARR